MTETKLRDDFNRTLKRIYARTLALRFSSGLVGFFALSGWLLLLLAVWAAAVGSPPLWQALVASRAALVMFPALFVLLVVVPLLRMPGFERLASEIEHRKDFKDIVVAAYEFTHDRESAGKYNPSLVHEVIRRAVDSIIPLNTRFLFLSRRHVAFVPIAYGGLLVLLFLSLRSPTIIMNAGSLVLHPRMAAALEHEANIHASPGTVTVLAGEDVEVSGLDFGGTAKPVRIFFSRSNGFWKSEPALADTFSIESSGFNRYSYTFRGLRSTLSYYFKGGEARSRIYTITVVHKPLVTDLEIIRTPPLYTGEAPDTLLESGGNVQALEGTHVTVTGSSNNYLRSASARFFESRDGAGGEAKQVRFSGKEFRFEFAAVKDEFYSILLEDSLGYKNDDPLVYAVEVFADNPPSLDVLEPGADASLPRNQMLQLSFVAADDYGVADAAVHYRRGGEEAFAKMKIPLGEQAGKKDIAESFAWNLQDITLFPGDAVEYYIQVKDNNTATGPGVAKSRIFQLTVPTMSELYDTFAREDSTRSDALDRAVEAGEEFRERVNKLSLEFNKTENLDWSQKKELDKAVKGHKQIQEKLQEIKSSLDKTLQELSDNQMTSQAIGEKLEEISKLLDEINSKELNDYVEELQKALEKLGPEEIKDALRNLSLSSSELLKKLERTADLLKAVRKQQEMEELVRESRRLMEKQKELLDETSASKSDSTSKMMELAERQQQLAKETESMKGAMEGFMKKLEEYEKETAASMESASQELSKSDAAGKMNKASQSLRRGEKEEASKEQEGALEDLISLFTSMSACQSSMMQMASSRQAVHLQKYARETLEVSFKQEQLLDDLRKASGSRSSDAAARALAERQLSYLKATEKIANDVFEISKQTTAVSSTLLQALGGALHSMQQAIYNFEQNKMIYSMPGVSEALADLNVATIEMLRAAKSCSSCSSGSGMDVSGLLQQLLSGQQQILEQSKEMLAMEMLQEKLRMEQQAKMKRLAGAQRSLKKIAEEIAKQLQESQSSLGRMNKVLEGMDEVIKDLEGGEFSRQTLDHEERILSRLLDAQRSVHTRDYERKRESTTAEDIYSKGPSMSRKQSSAEELREEIRRAMTLKAPGEFEELIKSYFRALAEEFSKGDATAP